MGGLAGQDRAGARERTTAVRDDLVVWGERCAWADLAAVGCEGWVSVLFPSGFAWGFERGVMKISLLISLSWYCDCAVEDTVVEAEPLEAVGDDILFRCRRKGEEGKVRSGPCEDGRCV